MRITSTVTCPTRPTHLSDLPTCRPAYTTQPTYLAIMEVVVGDRSKGDHVRLLGLRKLVRWCVHGCEGEGERGEGVKGRG